MKGKTLTNNSFQVDCYCYHHFDIEHLARMVIFAAIFDVGHEQFVSSLLTTFNLFLFFVSPTPYNSSGVFIVVIILFDFMTKNRRWSGEERDVNVINFTWILSHSRRLGLDGAMHRSTVDIQADAQSVYLELFFFCRATNTCTFYPIIYTHLMKFFALPLICDSVILCAMWLCDSRNPSFGANWTIFFSNFLRISSPLLALHCRLLLPTHWTQWSVQPIRMTCAASPIFPLKKSDNTFQIWIW